jgi:hypothetical protein
MSRTYNACEVCGQVVYPHFHSDTAQAVMEVTGTVNTRLTTVHRDPAPTHDKYCRSVGDPMRCYCYGQPSAPAAPSLTDRKVVLPPDVNGGSPDAVATDRKNKVGTTTASPAAPSLAARIETLAREFHEAYQREAKRQGDVRHHDDYDQLSENVKEFDYRALARHVIGRLDLADRLCEKIDDLLADECAHVNIGCQSGDALDRALAAYRDQR